MEVNKNQHDDDDPPFFEATGPDGEKAYILNPQSYTESRFYTVEAGDLQTDADVQQIVEILWLEPKSKVYYFFPHLRPPGVDNALLAARNRGEVLLDKLARRFYPHPRHAKDYVRILPPEGGKYQFDWQAEVIKEGDEFTRIELELSPRRKDELDVLRKIQMEDDYRKKLQMERSKYDVFLSYSAEDGGPAATLQSQLADSGINVFMAAKNLKGGDDFAEQIREALIGAAEVWVLVSPSSLRSEWVITEWGAAWALQKKLVPIFHRCGPADLPQRLARLHGIDLHDAPRLIRTLVDLKRPQRD